MLTSDPYQFVDAATRMPADFSAATAAGAMLMVDPDFDVSAETSADNQYLDLTSPAEADSAWRQQCQLGQTLRDLGLPTVSFSPLPTARDSVFPNNAFAPFKGRLITGAMRYPGRQQETSHPGVRRFFSEVMGYQPLDLADKEGVCELTGALIIDHARQLGFCGLSERVDEAGAALMHEAFDLCATLLFPLEDHEYHTNVMLSVLAGRAAVVYAPEPHYGPLRQALDALYGPSVCYLSKAEKNNFVANCLAVTGSDVVMSARAERSLNDDSKAFFQHAGFTIHGVEVSELEKAGGSVRCMIGEIF